MRVQGPVLARGFLDVRFNGLRDVVVVGLITCERVVLGKGAKVLISENGQEFVPHIMEEEAEDQEDEQDRQQEVEGRIAESQNNHIMSA